MKSNTYEQVKLLAFAVTQMREALTAVAELHRADPSRLRFVVAIDHCVAHIDYATASLAAQTDGTVYPGGGGVADPAITAASDNWRKRGRQTNDLAAA
jgi:hypothetical protein